MKSKIIAIFAIFLIVAQIFASNVYAKDKKENKAKTETKTNTTQSVSKENSKQKTEEKAETKEDVVKNYKNIKAKVISASEKYTKENEKSKEKYYVQDVTLKLQSGDRKDERVEAIYMISYDSKTNIKAKALKENQTVYVDFTETNGEITEASVTGVVRQNYILLIVLLFIISLAIIGKEKCIKLIIDLIIAFTAIYVILIINVYNGINAILLSAITCAVIIFIVSLIRMGLNKEAFSTMAGTICGLLISGLLMYVFMKISGITLGQAEVAVLNELEITQRINLRNLMISGIMIASIGSAFEISLDICSRLAEARKENHAMTWQELFHLGVEQGRESIFKIVNIVLFAVLGATLSFSILYGTITNNFLEFINTEIVTANIICIFACGIGVIYIVPITSIVYAILNRNKLIYKKKSSNIVEGKRSLKI